MRRPTENALTPECRGHAVPQPQAPATGPLRGPLDPPIHPSSPPLQMSHTPQPARWLPSSSRHRPHRDLLRRHLRPPAQAEGSVRSRSPWRLSFAALIITPVAFLQSRHELARLTRRRQIGVCWPPASSRAPFRHLDQLARIHLGRLEHRARHHQPAVDRPGLLPDLPRDADEMMIGGIALSFAGSLFIFWSSDSQTPAAPAVTRCSATCCADRRRWCFSAYLLIGRRLRAGLGLANLAHYGRRYFLFAASGARAASPVQPVEHRGWWCWQWRSDRKLLGHCRQLVAALRLPPSSRWSRWASRWATPMAFLNLRRRLRAATVRELQPAAGGHLPAKGGGAKARERLTGTTHRSRTDARRARPTLRPPAICISHVPRRCARRPSGAVEARSADRRCRAGTVEVQPKVEPEDVQLDAFLHTHRSGPAGRAKRTAARTPGRPTPRRTRTGR